MDYMSPFTYACYSCERNDIGVPVVKARKRQGILLSPQDHEQPATARLGGMVGARLWRPAQRLLEQDVLHADKIVYYRCCMSRARLPRARAICGFTAPVAIQKCPSS